MRQLIFTILMLCTIISVTAQNIESKYECIYKYTVSGLDKRQNPYEDSGYCMLQIGTAGVGKFYDYSTFQTDSLTQFRASDEMIKEYSIREQRNEFFFDLTVYQNMPKGMMTIQSVITPNLFSYEESRNPIKWTFDTATDTVCGYTCRVARGDYGGRTWIVKYAPEIPVQNGPWKLTGLPGLVMEAMDSAGIHHFSAIAFRKGSVDILPIDNSGRISTNRKKFISAKNEFEKNPIGNISPESIGQMEIIKHGDSPSESTVLINGVPLRQRTHPYIGLETE
ncbi:MAG: GLPGLI family protein [Muribaculaceae bacterium]|nr:GLPGLI family protein [Muribaculaceae bacterium]